jgi:hypothetical protein
MIDFAIANELKDAGFPQGGNGRWLVDPNNIVARGRDRAYVPTLEELIEACGDCFENLGRDTSADDIVWICNDCGKTKQKEGIIAGWYEGKTPTEAVARLWLALSKTA